ncbi:MAG: hypothetical protein Q9217_003783 [Psora testacea]
MDPITVLAAAATTLKIVKEVWDGLQWMQRIYETYTEGDKLLQSIALECNIYGESIKTIGLWLKNNQAATGLTRQMRTTHSAITLVQVSMANVLLDLKRFQGNGDQLSMKDKKISKEKMNIKLFQQFIMNKAKQQWFQETMRIHLVELRAHAATLHLTLGVIELTRHTPEHKEKTPEKLEAKTGKLEKRLLLRQFITKALEIKRAEIGDLAGRGESEQLPPNSFPGSIEKSPQKLTFYDVVQLARQQALVEKTRRSSEDLIDFSDTPQPVLNPSPSTSAQCDHHLLDSSNPMAPQQMHPPLLSQNESGTSKLNQKVELTSSQPAIAELDSTTPQKPSVVDLRGLVELPASPADDIHEIEPSEPLALAETSNQPDFQLYKSNEALTSKDTDTDKEPAALGLIGHEASQARGSHIKEANEPCAPLVSVDQPSIPIHQSSTALIDPGDDTNKAPTDNSPTSTAAPSIFSHSSSLPSATDSSLLGITEEDVQARSYLSQTSLESSSSIPKPSPSSVRRMALGSAEPPISKSPAHQNDADLYRTTCISTTPWSHMDLDFSSKPQRTQSEDSVSLSLSLPQLSNIDEPDKQGLPWIVQAARDGNEQMIQKLLVSGADITASDTSTRRHALSEASTQGHQKIVDLLIKEGCPLEYLDAEGNTALHHACRGGHLSVAKSLITNGALINALGPEKQTALHLAMEVPHQNLVMLLIQHKASVNARDASFRTPLHIGASQGNVAMCNYLLNEGAQLDSREAHSKTPLQLACEAGHYELVQMMLNQSNLNPTNMTFLTAFFAAVEYGHVRIAESFFSHGLKLRELKRDFHKPATLAAKSGYLAMIELMIQEDCNLNARDENGWNALHFASYYGHYQVIERLIACDVSAEATTSRKETPLLLAVKGGHFAVAERLLRSDKYCSLVSAEDGQGQQPVHHTVRAGSVEIFNLLMSNGGKINVENSFGWQPLHIATAYGHLALVERLLQQRANIDEKLGSSSTKKDQTHKIVEEGYWAEARWPYPGSRPLHLACEYGHEQIANYLISKGAKMEATCSEGWQPLHHATYFGSSALVEMLLKGGVNPHATTNEGKTALTLQFCTSGAPILEEEKESIRNLLKEAMDKVRKQKSFKVALKRGSTVEEKNNLVRAATFSMNVVSRPHMHKAVTTSQASDPALTHLDLVSSSHRPRPQHHPHTSPLPLTDSQPVSGSHHPPNPHLPVSQAEAKSPALPTTTDSNLKTTDTSASEASSKALTANNATDQHPLSSNIDNPNSSPAPDTEMQVSVQPKPKVKQKATFSLSKVKPGIDIGKLGLGSMGKPAFDIGKQTFDLGKQTLELGKQGLEISKQGLEMSKQGLEKSKQGLEIGKQGFNISKQGYKKARKFAKKGKTGSGKWLDRSKSIDGQNSIDGSKDGNKAIQDGVNHGGNNGNNDDDDDGSDDAGSVFSLGELAELGNDDF